MESFDYIWQLLAPVPKYFSRKRKCFETWQNLPYEEQRAIYNRIKDKKTKGQFVDYNPYYAILNNRAEAEPKEMSFDAYYKKYGTTEDTDGWKRVFLPDKRKTIYVKDQ